LKSAALSPGHEKRPAKPQPEGPRPGTRHRVRNGETWASVAQRRNITVRELIANNCGANVRPEEINWYLHWRVGCNETSDSRNWSFSDSADPGVIYVPAPGTAPASTQNPKIHTLYGGPEDFGCGGMEWLVEFELPRPAEGDGWIIQQIQRSYDIRKADGSVADGNLNAPKVTYWEAWPVLKGATRTSNRFAATADGRTYDDSFDQPARTNLKGVFKVVALAKFFEVTRPATFIKNNQATRAFSLHSTTVRPVFWDDTRTIHNLTVTWDCTDPKNMPEPAIIPTVAEKK
jgi:hypothetical protein